MVENMMLEFLASNDVNARSVEWNGNFMSSKRYGSETGPVTFQKESKTYTMQHTGYCVPERTCFVEFNTHRDAEKFLSMDLKNLTHGDSTPLYNARSCFEKTCQSHKQALSSCIDLGSRFQGLCSEMCCSFLVRALCSLMRSHPPSPA